MDPKSENFARNLALLDHRYVWHPFTQMKDWLQQEPIVIVRGEGALLFDSAGREFIDANSSIWTNLHGHAHPRLNAAIARQLSKIAHSSALGFANEPASVLAERLVQLAGNHLQRVFFSDDGSTALEVALKLAYQVARMVKGLKSPRFLSLQGAYHGDTVGAVSLGRIDLFHESYRGLLFPADSVMAPYCYRCPFNRAQPERADARRYRQCQWECIGEVERTFEARARTGESYAAFAFEPGMQGAAGMIPQPSGWLGRVVAIARSHGTQLIADEVMTGFGRTGISSEPNRAEAEVEPVMGPASSLFACGHEGVQPDYLCVAKGLTGGYVPMAATVTTEEVFNAFLGKYEEFKTFFHGHSFTANQVGAAAALESLSMLSEPACLHQRMELERVFERELRTLWQVPQVGDIRQAGLVVGIELVRDWQSREPFDIKERAGIRVCEAMARRGVLTRPVGNVIVLMPPYCTTAEQVKRTIAAVYESIEEAFGSSLYKPAPLPFKSGAHA